MSTTLSQTSGSNPEGHGGRGASCGKLANGAEGVPPGVTTCGECDTLFRRRRPEERREGFMQPLPRRPRPHSRSVGKDVNSCKSFGIFQNSKKNKRHAPSFHRCARAPLPMASPDDHDSFRAVTKRRLLVDMMGKVNASGGGEWKVLIVDTVTTPVLSACCGMSDLTNEGVSLVESLGKGREPQVHLDAVYFISPSLASLLALCADWSSGDIAKRLYRRAHVFFSSPIPKDNLQTLKKCKGLVASLATLVELNLEYQTKDTNTFTTGQAGALSLFFGDNKPDRAFTDAAETSAKRLATVLSSLGEFPSIRYGDKGIDDKAGTSPAAAVAHRLHRTMLGLTTNANAAAGQSYAGGSSQLSTCDVLILDRSFDPIAPVAREWTYEALLFDLLPIHHTSGLYTYEITTGTGVQKKQTVIGEHDSLFKELRHEHVAFALNALAEKAKTFGELNGRLHPKRGHEGTTGSLKRAVESLPRFMEAQAKLSIHTSIAASINKNLTDFGLSEVGRLEERVIFGEATSKEIIGLFNDAQASGDKLRPCDKLRLVLLYAASHPEKFDDTERQRWARATGLTQGDLAVVMALEKLGVKVRKPKTSLSTSAAAGVGFKTTKSKRPVVHERKSGWDLNRFLPKVNHLGLAMDGGSLSLSEYPELGGDGGQPGNGATAQPHGSPVRSNGPGPGTAGGAPKTPGKSARTARPNAGTTWASKNRKPTHSMGSSSLGSDAEFGGSNGGGGSVGNLTGLDEQTAMTHTAKKAQRQHHNKRSGSVIPSRRLIIFVVGGVTRGETREAFVLSEQLGREVLIGGTELFTPETFMAELARLGGGFSGALANNDDEVDLDDIVIE